MDAASYEGGRAGVKRMSLRLTLIAHAATAATRRADFPSDEGAEPQGLARAAALAGHLGRVDAAWAGPSRRTRETAEALGLVATLDPALRDIDLGAWAGRRLADIDMADLARWTADPGAAPHGGETVLTVVARVAGWLGAMQAVQGRVVAVTHAAVIRAAVVTILGADPRMFWRIDAEPLCRVRLQAQGGRWALRFVDADPDEERWPSGGGSV